MKLSDAKKVIKQLYKTNSVTALISERGVGKTSIYKQAAKELNIGYIDIYGAAMEGPDFMGLPERNPQTGLTTYLPPKFLPTTQAIKEEIYPEEGILVIEEINRIPQDTISILYPLMLEREFNGHKLAKGWKIGVTMNPDSMNYIVNSLDDAIIDRFVSIWIEPDITDYIEYSKNNNPNSLVLNYLKTYPEMLLITQKSSTALDKTPTPRGWSKVQEILNICDLDDGILQETLTGIIGTEASASFKGFTLLNKSSLPRTEDVLTNYDSIKESIYRLINNNRFDSLTLLINGVIPKVEPKSKIHMENLNQFLNDIPQDLQILFYRTLSKKREDILEIITEKLDSFNQVSDTIVGYYSK